MPDAEAATVIWITEGTWQASVDAALRFVQPGALITLLHVTPAELSDTAHGAYLGLFGRARPDRDPGPHVAKLAAQSAAGLLDAAAARLGRPAGRIERSGVPEREVVIAVADAALLIVARDGDRSRLGPKSLGKGDPLRRRPRALPGPGRLAGSRPGGRHHPAPATAPAGSAGSGKAPRAARPLGKARVLPDRGARAPPRFLLLSAEIQPVSNSVSVSALFVSDLPGFGGRN
jgi:hypothetical protein